MTDLLKQLEAAYTQWVGPPGDIVTMRRAKIEPGVPEQISVLFFLPDVSEDGPHDDFVTQVGTAGMSSVPGPGSYPLIELGLEIKGSCTEEQRKSIARVLADLACLPHIEKQPFHPNLVLEGITLPPFDRMDHALLAK